MIKRTTLGRHATVVKALRHDSASAGGTIPRTATAVATPPLDPPLRRRVTIADIARQCGVSPATVSRVLNNKSRFSASQAVRTRILETARRAGYAPDLAARNMTRSRTNIVGVFTSPLSQLAAGVNEPVLEGIAEVLHAGGYDVFLELGASPRPQAALPYWRFDGAILLQYPRADALAELEQRRVPYVCVNERVGNPLASVLADDRMGMRRAVEHLAILGHRRIAYANAHATYLTHYSVSERHQTLLDEARARSLELAAGHDAAFASASEFLRSAVLQAGATAVITYDHYIGALLFQAAHDLRLEIPGCFSLICFNDLFPLSVLNPPATAVAVSGHEMGRIGAQLLLNELQSSRPWPHPPPREVRIVEELMVRASTAPPPTLRRA